MSFLQNFKWKRWLFLLVILFIFLATMWFRGAGLVKCKIDGFDLDRTTDYSFITGACMYVNDRGDKVYLKRLIGVDENLAD